MENENNQSTVNSLSKLLGFNNIEDLQKKDLDCIIRRFIGITPLRGFVILHSDTGKEVIGYKELLGIDMKGLVNNGFLDLETLSKIVALSDEVRIPFTQENEILLEAKKYLSKNNNIQHKAIQYNGVIMDFFIHKNSFQLYKESPVRKKGFLQRFGL